MAQFEIANQIVLNNEGGYCFVKNDAGGETYAGIARNYHPDWSGWKIVDDSKPLKYNQRIKSLDFVDAVNTFYKKQYWDRILCDQITSQRIANIFYDWYVNAGKHATSHVAQIAGCSSINEEAIGKINGMDQEDAFQKIKESRIQFYRDIVRNKPSQAKFLNGWLRRTDSFN